MAEALESSETEYNPVTDPDTLSLAFSDGMKADVANKLRGKKAVIVVVGPAGVGKSSLVNSLVMRPFCQTRTGTRPMTDCLKRTSLEVKLGTQPSDVCSVEVIDSPGRLGGTKRRSAETDRETARQLGTIEPESIDALLCCFDMTLNAGRHTSLVHLSTMQWLKGIFGEELMKKKSLIVLTKGNIMSDDIKNGVQKFSSHNATPRSAKKLLSEWRKEYQTSCGDEREGNLLVPILMAGLVEFDEDTDLPKSRTSIDGSYKWLDQLWNGIGQRSGPKLKAVLFFINSQVRKTTPWAPNPTLEFLKEVALFAIPAVVTGAGTAALVAGVTLSAPVSVPVLGGIAAVGGFGVLVGMTAKKLYEHITRKEKKD